MIYSQGEDALYRRTARTMRAEISSGLFPPGARLASVRELAEKFKTSRKVVEQALNLLENDGLIRREPRRGIFIPAPESRGKILVIYSASRSDDESTAFQLGRLLRTDFTAPGELEFLDLDILRSASAAMVAKLRREGFTAVLLCDSSYCGHEPELEILRRLEIPVLIPQGNRNDAEITGFSVFHVDFQEGMRLAVSHLAGKGYRRIAAIGLLHPDYGPKLRCPLDFFAALLKEYGLTQPENPLFFLPEKRPDPELLRRFMEHSERFDAIICYSNPLALHLYEWCRNHHIAIPDDFGVISFGENFGAAFLEPPLTTIGHPIDDLRQAVLRFLRGDSRFCGAVNVNPILSIRKSCTGQMKEMEK